MPIVTLLTDFGIRDEYVGVMKGVMLGVAPQVRLVDLTHEIEPQDILQAAYVLNAAFSYFPSGTVHLAVVDPGVGGSRAAIAVRQGSHLFVAPDNGILSLILSGGVDGAFAITNPELFRRPISHTFHGRDIFAPAAAYLALGHPIENIGPPISERCLVRVQAAVDERILEDNIVGCVVAIDHFGNLMSNITSKSLEILFRKFPARHIVVHVGDTVVSNFVKSYSEVDPDQVLALIGSRGYVEISVNMGNAAKRLGVGKGASVAINFCDDQYCN